MPRALCIDRLEKQRLCYRGKTEVGPYENWKNIWHAVPMLVDIKTSINCETFDLTLERVVSPHQVYIALYLVVYIGKK